MNRRESILSEAGAVPSLPPSAVEAVRLLQSPDVDIDELTSAIELDPTLTSNILRLANSASFGSPRSISSVRQAVVRLGMNTVLRLAVTSAFAPLARRSIKGYDLPPGELLKHSVGVAQGTEKLAAALEIEASGHTFTAGLLHDVGKIVLGTFVEVDAGPIMSLALGEGISFELAEQQVLGIDHAEVGAILLDNWNLPQVVCDVVRWHHSPQQFEGSTDAVDLVHVADNLCLLGGIGSGSGGSNYRACPEVASRLGLTTKVSETVFCQVLSELEELCGLFAAGTGR